MNLPTNTRIMFQANNYISKETSIKMKAHPFEHDAIVFAKVGAAISHERKRIAYAPFLIDNNMMAFTPDSSDDITFIHHLFQRLKFSKYVQLGALPSYNASDILSIKTGYPPTIQERKKIVQFLDLLAEKIDAQILLINALKKYKRGLLSTSFTDTVSWRKKRLGDMCRICTGKLDANAMVEGGKYPFFTCARERSYIDTYAFDTDALLISGNGANVGYIHHYTGRFNAYQRTYVLDQFSEDINYVQVFLDRFLSSRIDAEKKAGNTPYIVLSTLADMEIFLPDETKMRQLVELFHKIGERIDNSNQVLELYALLRKGLMQQLFI